MNIIRRLFRFNRYEQIDDMATDADHFQIHKPYMLIIKDKNAHVLNYKRGVLGSQTPVDVQIKGINTVLYLWSWNTEPWSSSKNLALYEQDLKDFEEKYDFVYKW